MKYITKFSALVVLLTCLLSLSVLQVNASNCVLINTGEKEYALSFGENAQQASVVASTNNELASKKGDTYKIQLGAYRQLLMSDFYSVSKYGNVTTEDLPSGIKRVMLGEYSTLYAASDALKKVQTAGYGDAFIVEYSNKARVRVVSKKEVASVATSTATTYASKPAAKQQTVSNELAYWETRPKVGAAATERTYTQVDNSTYNYPSNYNYSTTSDYNTSFGNTTTVAPLPVTRTAPYTGPSTVVTTRPAGTSIQRPYAPVAMAPKPSKVVKKPYGISNDVTYGYPNKQVYNSGTSTNVKNGYVSTPTTTVIPHGNTASTFTPYQSYGTTNTASAATARPMRRGNSVATGGTFYDTKNIGTYNPSAPKTSSTYRPYQPPTTRTAGSSSVATTSTPYYANTVHNQSVVKPPVSGNTVYTAGSTQVPMANKPTYTKPNATVLPPATPKPGISGAYSVTTPPVTVTQNPVVYNRPKTRTVRPTPKPSVTVTQNPITTTSVASAPIKVAKKPYGNISNAYTVPKGTSVPMRNPTTTSRSRGGSSSVAGLGSYIYRNQSNQQISVPKSQIGISSRTYKANELPPGLNTYDANNPTSGSLANTGFIIDKGPTYIQRTSVYPSNTGGVGISSETYTMPGGSSSSPSSYSRGGGLYGPSKGGSYITSQPSPPMYNRPPSTSRSSTSPPYYNNRDGSSVTTTVGGKRNSPSMSGKTPVKELGDGNLDDAIDSYYKSYEKSSGNYSTNEIGKRYLTPKQMRKIKRQMRKKRK